jgi:hypothetical protein
MEAITFKRVLVYSAAIILGFVAFGKLRGR